MIGWKAADGPLWVAWNYHVEALNEWRVADSGRIIAHVPGEQGMQVLVPGLHVFPREASALAACQHDIDRMRRFFDDRAETVGRRLAAIAAEEHRSKSAR